jgi:hypothetical protein
VTRSVLLRGCRCRGRWRANRLRPPPPVPGGELVCCMTTSGSGWRGQDRLAVTHPAPMSATATSSKTRPPAARALWPSAIGARSSGFYDQDHLARAIGLVNRYAPGSWVTATSSLRAPSEAVRCAGRLASCPALWRESLTRALVSERAAVGWSSFRLDGTFLWIQPLLPAGNVTAYLRPLSGAGRSRQSPRTCAALSAPGRCS